MDGFRIDGGSSIQELLLGLDGWFDGWLTGWLAGWICTQHCPECSMIHFDCGTMKCYTKFPPAKSFPPSPSR
jgi:hypothetical protein